MDYRLLAYIARMHLSSRLKQSIIAAIGVTFGIGMFIALVTFMNGLNQLLDGLVLDRTPHIHLYREVGPSARQPLDLEEAYAEDLVVVRSIKPKQQRAKLSATSTIVEQIRSHPAVKGVSPQVSSQVFYSAGVVDLNGIVSGIEVTEEARLFPLKDYVVSGTTQDLARDDNGIIIGAGVAKKLGVHVKDRIRIVSPTGNALYLKIVGLYLSGLSEIDDRQSFVNIKTARRLLGESTNYVTDLNVKLYDLELAAPLSRYFAQLYGMKAVDIGTANADFDTGTSIRNLIAYAVSITLLLVAGFGIYNILNMFIQEKMNDIAILKATGFSGKEVKVVFLIQSMIIGAVGGTAGLLVGWGLSVVIDHTPFEIASLPTLTTYPITHEPVYYVIGITFALAATFFAGYLPANKAQKMDPVDILRGQ
ncbi:MAG: FtsX-like permease family protein [Bacteroidota bacterium]